MNSKNQKINIWELGTRINIKVDQNFIDFINNQIKQRFETKRKVHKELIQYYKIPYSTFKARMKRGYGYFIDLEVIMNLCKILDIDLQIMQKKIIAYKARRGHNYIENPKLPIEITPLFDMLIAHHIGDGTVVDPKNNRKPYFGYRQFDQHYMMLYVKKIESVFGKIKYKEEYKDKTRTYFPVAVSELLFKMYNLNTKSFLSKSARIPEDIIRKDKEYLLAFLLGIIIDDGHIDSTLIVIGLRNKNLAKDLKKICDILGYRSSYTEYIRNDYKEYGYLNILKEGMVNLWKDYNELIKDYPEVDLGYKGEQIESNLKIHERKIKWVPGNNRIILDLLNKRDYTVNELAKEINMTRQGVRYHIHKLEKQGNIKIKDVKGENNYVYSLIQ